eukprot:jgi/Mesen1/6764/ME000346S05942
MAASSEVIEVQQALAAAYDWQSSLHVRAAAVDYLDKLKSRRASEVATIAFTLVADNQPAPNRVFAYQLLRDVAKSKWNELSEEEKQQMGQLAFNLTQATAAQQEPFSMKSKAAAVLGEVVRSQGATLWKELLPALLSSAAASPVHAEVTALVLQFVAEDVTVHNEDLEGERKRQLLQALTHTLPDVLQFLYQSLERHFSAALQQQQQSNPAAAQAHAAAVTAALNAAGAYADWAPLPTVGKSNLINACAYFLSAPEFRLSACDFLAKVAARKRPGVDDPAEFGAVIVSTFDALSGALQAAASQASGGDQDEYIGRLVAALASMAPQNIRIIVDRDDASGPRLNLYLQLMMRSFQSRNLEVHVSALHVWQVLLREAQTAETASGQLGTVPGVPDGGAPGGVTGKARKSGRDRGGSAAAAAAAAIAPERKILLPPECYPALLDVVIERLPKKGVTGGGGGDGGGGDPQEASAGDFGTSQEFGQYKGSLMVLLRLIAAMQPVTTARRVAPFLDASLTAMAASSPTAPQALLQVDEAQVLLEAVMGSVPPGVMEQAAVASRSPAGASNELAVILEGVMQRLLSQQPQEPCQVEVLARLLGGTGAYCRHSPACLPGVLPRFFALLSSLPPRRQEEQSKTAQGKSAGEVARAQVCASIAIIARVADAAFLPHMAAMAELIAEMRRQQLLQQSELNQLGDALLAIGAAAGPQQQVQLLEWLLGPVEQQWEAATWQRHLADPLSFALLLSPSPTSAFSNGLAGTGGGVKSSPIPPNDGGPGSYWWILHAVALFEKAFVRTNAAAAAASAARAAPPGGGGSQQQQQQQQQEKEERERQHPMVAHMAWLLPRLLQLLRYNVLGLAASGLGTAFFATSAQHEVAGSLRTTLLEHLPCMESRHVKLLIHLVITPMARACPPPLWPLWVGALLPPLLTHCAGYLTDAWGGLLRNGALPPAGGRDGQSEAAVRDEVLGEKLLRDLTREFCSFLALLPSLPPPPPGAADGGEGEAERATRQQLQLSDNDGGDDMRVQQMQQEEQPSRETLLHWDAARAALHLAASALTWPDTESANRAISFCHAAAHLPSVAFGQRPELRQVVGQDLFRAGILALTLESNAVLQGPVCALLRDTYVRFAAFGLGSGPREVLLTVPAITPASLAEFDEALGRTNSAREQRQLLKSLLLQGDAGEDHLRAFAAQRGSHVINVHEKVRVPGGAPRDVVQEGGPIGLAAFGV